MRRILSLLLLCTVPVIAAHAQGIDGRVLDRATGQPLRGVRLSIVGDTSSVDYTETTRDGEFTLVAARAGRYQLRFQIAANVQCLSDPISIEGDDFVERDFPLVVPRDVAYYDFQVARQALPVSGGEGPIYPETLKNKRIEATVVVQFIVDSTGRMRPGSFHVMHTTHAAFVGAVRIAVEHMHFTPAERDGHTVAQLVQLPFAFHISQ